MARRVAAAQELSLARRDLDRIAALPQVASRREAESAEARLRAAEAAGEAAVAEVAILEAAARGAEDSATRHVLEAPVDGVITTADVTHGEAVDAGHVLYTILDPARLSVRADVPEGQAHALLSLAPGAEARVVPAGGRPGGADAGATATAPARFAGASRSIDSATRSVAAYFDVAEGGHALLEGQLVDVLVASAATVRGFLLPASAVVAVDGQPVVFAHAAAEAFVPRPIRLGVTDGDSVEVLEGLDGGERVVVSGASQVRAALLAGGR
jgi:cobalt-zinc-cadmium efflux system membrane fusion protein